MGLILDTSILIADERGKFDMPGFLLSFPSPRMLISAITASELLHGVERAQDPARRARRQHHVEQVLVTIFVQPFDLAQARCHARIRTDLETRGQMIGAYDFAIPDAVLLAAGMERQTRCNAAVAQSGRVGCLGASRSFRASKGLDRYSRPSVLSRGPRRPFMWMTWRRDMFVDFGFGMVGRGGAARLRAIPVPMRCA